MDTKARRLAKEYAKSITDDPKLQKMLEDAHYAGYFKHLNNWLHQE